MKELTVASAARHAGVSYLTIIYAIARGWVQSRRTDDGTQLVDADSLNTYIRKRVKRGTTR